MRVGVARRKRWIWSSFQIPKINKDPIVMSAAVVFLLVLSVGGVWLFGPHLSNTVTLSTAQEGLTRAEIQADLDKEVADSMMTVSVSPVMSLDSDANLSCNLENDASNTFYQRFTITQDNTVIFESEAIEPGTSISEARVPKAVAGAAIIEIQALDPDSLEAHGNPTAVEVTITDANT